MSGSCFVRRFWLVLLTAGLPLAAQAAGDGPILLEIAFGLAMLAFAAIPFSFAFLGYRLFRSWLSDRRKR